MRVICKIFSGNCKLLLVFALLLLSINTVSALTVSPVIEEITVDPGKTYSGVISLVNEEDRDKTFYTSAQNFEPRGESGTPFFIGAEDGLATWINMQPEVFIRQGENIFLPYTISVPAETKPGGYFASIFLGAQPPVLEDDPDRQVSIGGKVGVLVLLRVAGDIEEKGGIAEFGTEEGKRFYNNLPINFMYRFNNDGGDRVAPVGEISIKNIFGVSKDKFTVNDQKSNILPGSIRKFNYSWGEEIISEEDEEQTFVAEFLQSVKYQWNNFYIGYYTANLSLAWGLENEESDTADFSFYVLPWQLALVFLIFFVFIIIGFKVYNKWIISQALAATNAKPKVSTKKKSKK